MPYGVSWFAYVIIAQVMFFIVTTALIVWFVKSSKQKDISSPKDILDKRLASGEINKKQHDSLLKTITNKEE